MPFHLLEEITDHFSADRKLGADAYGTVYMGDHRNGEKIAVKVLRGHPQIDHTQFEKECLDLASIQHKNIVQLVGYCDETTHVDVMYNGRRVSVENRNMALCSEYMHYGSLYNWLSDESRGHDWRTRYAIIKGICDGLKYLHEELESPMYHLDLKPQNILLDERLVPKIKGFGSSNFLRDEQETRYTRSYVGTPGYVPPEYRENGIISVKFDIFSLGVTILKIMAGREGYITSAEMSSSEFIENVHGNWRNRLEKTSTDELESYCKQVKTCIEIAFSCVEANRHKRPTIEIIVNKLNQTETISQLLDGLSKPLLSFVDQHGSVLRHPSQPPPPAPQMLCEAGHMSLQHLKEITKDFSEEQILGRGASSVVYKGVLQNGEMIAVKVLHDFPGLDVDDTQFGMLDLASIQHKNIVRLVGYCHETMRECEQLNGKMVFVNMTKRALCFEYMHNGSLDKYLSDESSGHDWFTRYAIIKGICDGLKYLHQELESPMYHLDLKPQLNVLLDERLVPKLIDFSYSRFFRDEQEQIQMSSLGTVGYVPPEYIENGTISTKSDIFSLGVTIINIMAGRGGYFRSGEMSSSEFIENVHVNWRNRLEETSTDELESYCKQVKTCAEIALRCVEADRFKRPTIGFIVNKLNETETMIMTSMSQFLPVSTASSSVPPPPAPQMRSEPHYMSLQHLKEITKDFSEEQILGRGGSCVVYKGELQNGEIIAVKKVELKWSSEENCKKSKKQFKNEVKLLMQVKHPNIVKLLGHCYETHSAPFSQDGAYILLWQIDCLLCLEFLPESLHNHISDATSGLDWRTRYKIIEGISDGIKYLHEQSVVPIIHLDLKPENILLDANMVPKIADFGISRLYDQGKTIHTETTSGTRGYMPPEFSRGSAITPMADIFSLGVIIMEVITGHRAYPYDLKAASEEFINTELSKWRNMLEKEPGNTNIEADCHQIGKCIEIGLMCVNPDRCKRPTIRNIINMLQGLESTTRYNSN